MSSSGISLKVLLPHRVFGEWPDVTRIVAEMAGGSFGLLPHRLDCVAALVPGIFTFAQADGASTYLALDRGILVKTGLDVSVSVRNAVGGPDLGRLRTTVEREFLNIDAHERQVRVTLARLESAFVRRLVEVRHG